jgi:hypothetical protein
MKSHNLRSAFARCGLILMTMSNSQAQPPTTEAASPQAKWPDTFTVTAGDVRTRIEAAKMWTMSGLEYQNTVMATEDSAYGTVITIRGAGHLGSAHFLDVPGKPGQVEKEKVKRLKLFVDDKPVTDFSSKMKASGNSFRMERKSNIRSLELEETVDIREGVVIETSKWHATEPIDLQASYPLHYAWTAENRLFIFGDDSGIQKRGVFRKKGEATTNDGLEKSSRWMAVFNPASGKGSVCYLLKHPADAVGWLQWTDAPGIYRKLRTMSFVDKIVPQGYDGTFQSAVGFFAARESDWENRALKRVDELKAFASTMKRP